MNCFFKKKELNDSVEISQVSIKLFFLILRYKSSKLNLKVNEFCLFISPNYSPKYIPYK